MRACSSGSRRSSGPRARCSCSPPRAAARWSPRWPTSSAPASRRSWPPAASSASAGPSCATPTARDTIHFEAGWGNRVEPGRARCRLADEPGVKVVFTTLSETSTGVVNDVRELTEVAHRHGALIAVDAVSGLGAVPLPAGRVGRRRGGVRLAEGADGPPGLGFASPNERALERAAGRPGGRYYFDWARTVDGPAQGPAGQPLHARRSASSARSTWRSG